MDTGDLHFEVGSHRLQEGTAAVSVLLSHFLNPLLSHPSSGWFSPTRHVRAVRHTCVQMRTKVHSQAHTHLTVRVTFGVVFVPVFAWGACE